MKFETNQKQLGWRLEYLQAPGNQCCSKSNPALVQLYQFESKLDLLKKLTRLLQNRIQKNDPAAKLDLILLLPAFLCYLHKLQVHSRLQKSPRNLANIAPYWTSQIHTMALHQKGRNA
ncbi:hypothetical protein ADN00_18965 [Ornatilinea apprima]|uniref:Uncharacterized protein n=1 Tax=Ornatilinea apprima TaxID=1134406 RepID=A0A0P6WVY8_9CHLR|nr:hypothetical protein ADN00_18965 [Ornatilinea apprima]